MDLSSWEGYLSRHFEHLGSSRRAQHGTLPVFALEHGLDKAQTEDLSLAVRTHIARSEPSRDHGLAWTVYAAEIGYQYSGDEYWQTFEDETPGWTENGDRYWIRTCFAGFSTKYGGARPSGPWAEHFSIICWPITHAILPRDLQRQLARVLYEVRHSFSAEFFDSPPKLGELIAARSWNASSRFQNFAQDSHLVGQISVALLLPDRPGTSALIHPATLQRIGADLDRERRAREWLRGAQRFAQERATIRGLALAGKAQSPIRRPDEARAEVATLGIEPRLVLRPKASDASRWEPFLEIPDLSPLLLRFPQSREALTGSRCVVAGASGRPLARGHCLHRAHQVKLSRWPQEGEVLLQFEQKDAQLEYLLSTECLLRPGPRWLFRIASDGLAYESRSLRVRPGERYVLVTTAGPIAAWDHARPVELECEGVRGVLLELPAALTGDWEEVLRRLGLVQAKRVEVWPAGLSAAVWDGEGHGEWLASERPCLAIRTDHPIAALLVSMGTYPDLSLELTSVTPGEPIFVQLPQLPVGLHTVRVCARSSTSAEVDPLGDLDVVMRIREARPWSPGVTPQGPLVIQVDPVGPTLEELWEGRVEVSVRGPVGRHVKCVVSLLESDYGEATVTKRLPPVPFPVTPEIWRRHFEKHFQETGEAPRAYDTARACEIEFTCEELGAFTIRCEREFTPLRWAVGRRGQRHVRLQNDSGHTSPPEVVRLPFETPTEEQRLELALAYDVPSAGGLYVARLGSFMATIIIPPVVRDLANLRCEPQLKFRERSTGSVLETLEAASLWASARLPGDLLSATRQRDVLRALARQTFQLVGGDRWASAEQFASKGPNWIAELKRSVSTRSEETRIGEDLEAVCRELSRATNSERIESLNALASRYQLVPGIPTAGEMPGVSYDEAKRLAAGLKAAGLLAQASEYERQADRRRPWDRIGPRGPLWLSEFALRLASDPGGVKEWAGNDLRQGTNLLLELPALARAARFLVIAMDHHLGSKAAPGEVYAGWRWT